MRNINGQSQSSKINTSSVLHIVKLTVGVALFLGLLLGVVYIYNGVTSRYSKLKYTVIKGNTVLPSSLIRNLATSSGYSSLSSYDLSRVYFNIISNPWVATAKVTKIFPDTIFVVVKEKKPAGMVFWNKNTYIIDANGDIIDTYKPYLHLPSGLPRLVLKYNVLSNKRILKAVILMNEKLDKIGKINYIDIVSNSYQVVHFRNGLNVVVNSLDCPDVALKRLRYKWSYLNSLKNKLDSVSICFDNKFVLKWKKGVGK